MYEGQLDEKERGIAEPFNNHFNTIGPKFVAKIETKDSDDPLKYVIDEGPSSAPSFEFHPVDLSNIEKEITKLNCSNSAGYDKVSVKLVKDAAGNLFIFNSSLELGIFPAIWKIARVAPIFKSGSKNDMGNYRLIFVLSVFSRLLEK